MEQTPAYKTDGLLFRQLSESEVADFERYARENDPPSDDWSLYHPACRRIWVERSLLPKPGDGMHG